MTTPFVSAAPAARSEKTIVEMIADLALVPFNTFDTTQYNLIRQGAVLTDDAASIINAWKDNPACGQKVKDYFKSIKPLPYKSGELLPREIFVSTSDQPTPVPDPTSKKRRLGRFVW